jgi:hypothetical protein
MKEARVKGIDAIVAELLPYNTALLPLKSPSILHPSSLCNSSSFILS